MNNLFFISYRWASKLTVSLITLIHLSSYLSLKLFLSLSKRNMK